LVVVEAKDAVAALGGHQAVLAGLVGVGGGGGGSGMGDNGGGVGWVWVGVRGYAKSSALG